MRADRLLSILFLLQAHKRLTAREMGERLEVSERTIHRDMLALSTSGVPVAAERGSGGGWYLAERYETNLTGLSLNEVQALFLDKPAHLMSDLGLTQASEGAVLKLLASLPTLSRGDAEKARERLLIDAPGWRRSEEDVTHLPALYRAVWRGLRVRFVYKGADGEERERVADPFGLVAKGRAWYVVAGVESEIRTYRISRIGAVSVTEEPIERPAGFDLAEHWERSRAAFVQGLPRYQATFRAAPEAVAWLRGYHGLRRLQIAEQADSEGKLALEAEFEIEEEALRCVLAAAGDVEVTAPKELRSRVYQAACRMTGMHTA